MKKLQWAAGLLLSFSVIAILLISSFEIVMYADFSVYQKEYEKYDVLDELDMDMEDVMHVTEEMMAYLRGDRDTLSVVTTVEGKEQDFFNKQDRFHMGEVRDLFIGGLNIRDGCSYCFADLSGFSDSIKSPPEKNPCQVLSDCPGYNRSCSPFHRCRRDH